MLSLKSRALAGSSIMAVMNGAALVALSACTPQPSPENSQPDYSICDDTVNAQCAEPRNIIVENSNAGTG